MTICRRPAAALAPLVLAAALLSGCGSSSSGSDGTAKGAAAETSTVAAATGDTLTGTGYTYRVPDDWKDAKSTFPSADSGAATTQPVGGFADNVNVTAPLDASGHSLDDLDTAVKSQLKSVKVSDLTTKPRVSIDGTQSVHLSGGMNLNGAKYTVEQYDLIHSDKVYSITFSFSTTRSAADREALAQSVLASWKWTD